MIDRIQFSTGLATGTAGSATATGYSQHVSGIILAVNVAYGDSPPGATTDFTLTDENDPATENIVTLTNNATDAKLYPRRQVQSNANAGLTYDGTRTVNEPYVVHGRLKAKIDQANANDYCLVTVWLRPG